MSGNKTIAPQQVGNLTVVNVLDPAIGVGFSYTAPAAVALQTGGQIQRILSIRYTLATGVDVADRIPGIRLRLSPGTENLQLNFSDEATPQVASTTFSYLFQLGMPVRFYTVSLNKMVALSPMWMLPGQTIDSVIDGGGIQVGDQISRIQIVLQSWDCEI